MVLTALATFGARDFFEADLSRTDVGSAWCCVGCDSSSCEPTAESSDSSDEASEFSGELSESDETSLYDSESSSSADSSSVRHDSSSLAAATFCSSMLFRVSHSF